MALVNLALAFSRQGHRAGILDTDIFGPSIPTLLNLSGEPRLSSSKPLPPPIPSLVPFSPTLPLSHSLSNPPILLSPSPPQPLPPHTPTLPSPTPGS